LSRNYVVLEFKGETRYHYYVLGVNTDGKVFINKLRNFSGETSKLLYMFKRESNVEIPIYLIDDVDVYRYMGFGHDIECSEDKTIPKYHEGYMIDFYRIQGDIVFRISEEITYFENIRMILADQVERILTRVILQRIQAILAELGISSEITLRFGREVLVFRGFPRDMTIEEIRYYMERIFALLKRKLNVNDIANTVEFGNIFDTDQRNDEIRVDFFDERAGFGERFEPTIIRTAISRRTIIKFVNQIMNELKLELEDRIIQRGRHLIRYRGFPSRFTILTKLPGANGVEEEYIIPIDLNIIHVVKGKIYMYHPEHGNMEINVAENLTIEIGSIMVDDDFEERLNYYAIKLLPDPKQLSLL
jgi:hypothetical protein